MKINVKVVELSNVCVNIFTQFKKENSCLQGSWDFLVSPMNLHLDLFLVCQDSFLPGHRAP